MKLTKYSTIFVSALFVAALTAGCQKAANSNTAANQPANANNSNANKPAAEKSPDAAKSDFSLATPTDAYKTAWAVREKKDVEGMKKVVSKDILDFWAEIGKEENKTVEDEIKDLFSHPQAKTAEARNEKITGDTATIEYLDEDGGWKTMDFVKDGNDWKLTMPKADKSATTAPEKKK